MSLVYEQKEPMSSGHACGEGCSSDFCSSLGSLCDLVWGIWIATLLSPHKHLLTCKDAWVICEDLPGLWLDTLYTRGDKE